MGRFPCGKLCFIFIWMYCSVFLFSTGNDDLHLSHRSKIRHIDDKKRLTSIVKRVVEIKMDCGSLCETSQEAEKQIHAGN